MARFRDYTGEQKRVALSFLEVCRGDIAAAARYAQVEEAALRFWVGGGDENAPIPETETPTGERPRPPRLLADEERYPEKVIAAPDVERWMRDTFLDEESPLYNADHAHLEDAVIGVLWTNVKKRKGGHQVIGTAEIPLAQVKEPWQKIRGVQQLVDWFGTVPHFIITLDSVVADEWSDARFCALIEHELYHCAVATDEYGTPKFDKRTGEFRWTLRGHDFEGFHGVSRRYGIQAAESGVAELAGIARRASPFLDDSDIASCCGC